MRPICLDQNHLSFQTKILNPNRNYVQCLVSTSLWCQFLLTILKRWKFLVTESSQRPLHFHPFMIRIARFPLTNTCPVSSWLHTIWWIQRQVNHGSDSHFDTGMWFTCHVTNQKRKRQMKRHRGWVHTERKPTSSLAGIVRIPAPQLFSLKRSPCSQEEWHGDSVLWPICTCHFCTFSGAFINLQALANVSRNWPLSCNGCKGLFNTLHDWPTNIGRFVFCVFTSHLPSMVFLTVQSLMSQLLSTFKIGKNIKSS